MPRPITINDIPADDKFEQIGVIYTDKLSTAPTLLKMYATLLEQVKKEGGRIIPSQYSRAQVELFIPRDLEQLKQELKNMQYRWDEHKKLYDRAVNREMVEDNPLREYEKDYVKEFAKKEGLPDPFDVFAANDPELASIRGDLGMNE